MQTSIVIWKHDFYFETRINIAFSLETAISTSKYNMTSWGDCVCKMTNLFKISDQYQGLKTILPGARKDYLHHGGTMPRRKTSSTKFWMLKWILDSLIYPNQAIFREILFINEKNKSIEKCSSKCQAIHNHRWKCIIIFYWIWKLMWYSLSYRQCYNMYSFLASLLKRLRFL